MSPLWGSEAFLEAHLFPAGTFLAAGSHLPAPHIWFLGAAALGLGPRQTDPAGSALGSGHTAGSPWPWRGWLHALLQMTLVSSLSLLRF